MGHGRGSVGRDVGRRTGRGKESSFSQSWFFEIIDNRTCLGLRGTSNVQETRYCCEEFGIRSRGVLRDKFISTGEV